MPDAVQHMKHREKEFDPDEPALVLTTKDQIQMAMVQEALERENIPVLLKSVMGYHDRGMLPFGVGFFDYRLYVARRHESRAREIIEMIVPPEEIR